MGCLSPIHIYIILKLVFDELNMVDGLSPIHIYIILKPHMRILT